MPVLDNTYPPHERLPDIFSLHFIPQRVRNQPGMRIEAEVDSTRFQFGDLLNDNAHTDDGYRYHDIFHAAFAIFLGWSPNTRAFLSRKRKSTPMIDEIEDGARARAIEEAVSAAIFAYLSARSFPSVDVTSHAPLFDLIEELVRGREVATCTREEWKDAINAGYSSFLRINSDAPTTFTFDRINKTIFPL